MIAHERFSVRRGNHPLYRDDVAVAFFVSRHLAGKFVGVDDARKSLENIGVRSDNIDACLERAKDLVDRCRDLNVRDPETFSIIARMAMEERLKSAPAHEPTPPCRSIWRTLRALVLIVGLVFLFLALSNWLDRYFEYDVDKWLCVLLSALICGSAAMVVFFPRFVYRKVVAVTKRARLLVRKFEEDTRL